MSGDFDVIGDALVIVLGQCRDDIVALRFVRCIEVCSGLSVPFRVGRAFIVETVSGVSAALSPS